MHPAQRNKIDISKLNPQEQQLFSKYGKLPTHKNVLMKMQKDRKYFDSGDYALSKAGKAPQTSVGTAIPNPENIPHASTPTGNGHNNGHPTLSISPTNSISPILQKESGLATDENTTPPVDGPESAIPILNEATISAETTTETTPDETTEPVASIAEAVSITETIVIDKSPE
ncbi:camp-regulated phospho protein/endosulfine conserved region-domain-containing protein [Ephemerocybe angulata]|uniref:mRNA stability protein n=1 Tax=Ephemerocybe angulata TaxID=980116 RepID=A0A8H6I461_9AGAR|nr:camp-regulated phospho protein/endosulfine conserved region-domain-containing protein [Tulosesus angulatus]